jgi:hypothetical protein
MPVSANCGMRWAPFGLLGCGVMAELAVAGRNVPRPLPARPRHQPRQRAQGNRSSQTWDMRSVTSPVRTRHKRDQTLIRLSATCHSSRPATLNSTLWRLPRRGPWFFDVPLHVSMIGFSAAPAADEMATSAAKRATISKFGRPNSDSPAMPTARRREVSWSRQRDLCH